MAESVDTTWPEYLDRVQAAEYVTRHYFKVTPRTVKDWPLTTYRPAKRAVHRRDEVDMLARGIVESSLRTRSNAAHRAA